MGGQVWVDHFKAGAILDHARFGRVGSQRPAHWRCGIAYEVTLFGAIIVATTTINLVAGVAK